MTNDELLALESLLANALTSADPARIVQRAADDPALSDELQLALRSIDLDGLRISALLVAKLHFERLLQGSTSAGAWFESDPRGFTAAFKRYHHELAPRAETPAKEAGLFEAWRAAGPIGEPQSRHPTGSVPCQVRQRTGAFCFSSSEHRRHFRHEDAMLVGLARAAHLPGSSHRLDICSSRVLYSASPRSGARSGSPST